MMVNIKEFGDRAFVNQQKYKTEKAVARSRHSFFGFIALEPKTRRRVAARSAVVRPLVLGFNKTDYDYIEKSRNDY